MRPRQKIPLEKIVAWLHLIEATNLPKPVWLEEKQVFEYEKVTVEIVAFLKMTRAVQSLHSLPLLCRAGLFLDYETIIRCIQECCNQTMFLLENYPEITPAAKKFVEHFECTTIDEHLEEKSTAVQSTKIHSANARILERAGFSFDDGKKLIDRAYKAMSTSTHSLYAATMQMYGGPHGQYKFQVRGIPSERMKKVQAEWIDVLNITVTHALYFLALALKAEDIIAEMRPYIFKIA